MSIAKVLNILVQSPSEALKADLRKQQMSISQFARSVNDALGGAFNAAASDAIKMGQALGAALDDGLISAQQYTKGIEKAAEVQKFLTAGGQSYNAMQTEAARLTEKHTSALVKQASAMARLQAMKGAGMITPATFTAAADEITGDSARRSFATQLRYNSLKVANEESTQQQLRAAQMRYDSQKEALEQAAARRSFATQLKYNSLKMAAEQAAAAAAQALAVRQAQQNALTAEANSLNNAHATALERLKQAQLRLNAVRATGLLTSRAFTEEMRLANQEFREQTSVLGKLGLTKGNLKGAAGIFGNPIFLSTIALGAGIKVFGEFERSMDRVAALTGATAGEIIELTNKASELGRTTVFSAKDAAEGMAALAQAGQTSRQILESMGPTLRLAAVGMIDVGEAAEITSRIMAGMKLPASELHDVVDAIAVAASNSINTVQDLGEALKFVGPVAQQAGMSLEDTMASLMVLGNAGLQGEIGGTGLRNVILRLVKPTEEAAAAIDRLGVSLEGADGKMRPMVDIIRQFETATAKLGDFAQLKVLSEIFKTRSTTVMSALVGAGAEEFQRMIDALEERAGVSAAMERELNDNLFGDFEMLTSALSGLATDANGLGDVLRAITNTATILVKGVQAVGETLLSITYLIVGTIEATLGDLLQTFSFGKFGKELTALGESHLEGAMLAGNSVFKTLGEMGDAFGRAFSGTGARDSELAVLKEKLQSKDAEIRKDAELRIAALEHTKELQRQLERQKALVSDIEESVSKRRDDLGILILGKSAYERLQLLERARKNDAVDIVKAKLEELAAIERTASAIKRQQDAMQAIRDAVMDSVHLTAGQQKAQDLGLGDWFAGVVDYFDGIKSVREAIAKAQEDQAKLSGQDAIEAAGGMFSKFDEMRRDAQAKAMADGSISAIEAHELATLDAILKQNEALEKRLDKRKAEREELKQYLTDMHKLADELTEKHNPAKAFGDAFIELRTLFANGLIDQATFDSELETLTNKALRSAGPRNIENVKGVTADSVEGQLAALRKVRNPEHDTLKKSLDVQKQSVDALRKIRDNTAKLLTADELFDIPT